MIQQQADRRGPVLGLQRMERCEVFRIERYDVAETAEIVRAHLPRTVGADVGAMPQCHRVRPAVRGFAYVPVPRAGRIDLDIEAGLLRFPPERGLRQRRAADVAETYE